MTLEQLETFAVVAASSSFTQASKSRHLSQPAISKQIRSLEMELEEPLFERRRPLRLTPAGELLLEHVSVVAAAVRAARDGIASFRQAQVGRLAVGTSHSIATSVMPILVKRYRKRHPGVRLNVQAGWSHEIMQQVVDRTLDLGIVILVAPELEYPPMLKCTPLTKSEIVVAISRAGSLRRNEVTLDEIPKLPWILSLPGCPFRAAVEKRLVSLGSRLNLVAEVNGFDLQKRIVASGMGVALLPKATVRAESRDSSIRAMRIKGLNLQSVCCLVYRQDRLVHPCMSAFLSMLREVLRTNAQVLGQPIRASAL